MPDYIVGDGRFGTGKENLTRKRKVPPGWKQLGPNGRITKTEHL